MKLIHEGEHGKVFWDAEKFQFYLDRPHSKGYFNPMYLPPVARTDFAKAMIDFWATLNKKDDIITAGENDDDFSI